MTDLATMGCTPTACHNQCRSDETCVRRGLVEQCEPKPPDLMLPTP